MAAFDRARRARSCVIVAVLGAVLVLGAVAPTLVAPGVGLGRGFVTTTTTAPALAPALVSAPSLDPPRADAIAASLAAARAGVGLAPYARDPALDSLAGAWAGRLAASGALGSSDLEAALADPGLRAYRALGESVQRGSGAADAATIVESLLDRPTHHANLLSSRFDTVGIGVAVSGDAVFVVVDLAVSW